MCGIAGFAGISLSKEDRTAKLRDMCDAILHRGPDSAGYFVADQIALGMRRLSIIDIGGGDQPISNETGDVTVVFNGEIYNHRPLRAELESKGHVFRTRSDTEVLVHLYEELGVDMVSRLRGMFAFAIWDSRDRSLFIARDRTGMKPLNFLPRPDGLIFFSENRSLLAFMHVTPRISGFSVNQYLAFGYVPDPGSIFEGVKKLPAGHFLTWTSKTGITVKRYWKAPEADQSVRTEDELVEELRAKLEHSVSSHLESEVPLGAFLSGGLDSSTVVALMSKYASGRVRTFSIGFAEDRYDESDAARLVANELGTEHTQLILDPNVEDTLDSIALMFDEPFGDSSAIPTFFVAQLARESVTVALSGDGGDELFGGYDRYSKSLRHRNNLGRLGKLLSATGLMLPHITPGRNRMIDLGRSLWGRYASQVAYPIRIDEGGVATPNSPGATVKVEERFLDRVANDLGDDLAATMMRVDLETYLPGDILTKVDRTSMAVSLEARVPLLDFDLVDFAFQLPSSLRVTEAGSKRLFRRAISDLIPQSVLGRPKQGFAIPLAEWFRGPLSHRADSLRNLSASMRDYVDTKAVQRLVAEHSMGRRDHSQMLWRLIVLDRWLAALRDGTLGRPPSVPRLPIS